MTVPVRVADVCAHQLLANAHLVGVPHPTANAVAAVDLLVPDTVVDADLNAHAAVVLALDAQKEGNYQEHLVDVVIRRASQASASMVVAVGAELPLADATIRLAESLRMPLVLPGPDVSPTDLVVSLRALVSQPLQPLANLVLEVSRRLRRGLRELDQITDMLAEALPGANVYACSARDLVLAGTPALTTPEEVVAHGTPSYLQRGSSGAAVVPVEGLTGEPSVWLVAERERAGRMWLDSAVAALGLCGGAVLAWLAREQAILDHDARRRTALLTEILERPHAITREMANQIVRVGWQLEGWHTGIHIRFNPPSVPSLTMRELSPQLSPVGLKPSSLVERSDGWAAWVTVGTEPGPDFARGIARRIEQNVQPPDGHSVVVGVGSPQRDVHGIAATLAEARQAAVVAASSAKPLSVRVLQELGPSRLLLGWYSSDAFADYAREALGPLVDSDEPELLQTLEAYLERACSATQTARVLGIHRNTVAQRVLKAERILGATVSNPDTRLALQLALRVMHADPDDGESRQRTT